VTAADEASITRRSSRCVFHGPNSSAACRSWPWSSARASHAGVDADHQPIGLLSPVAAHQQPAGAAGQIGHVGTSEVPAFLKGRDARVAAADFWRDGGDALRVGMGFSLEPCLAGGWDFRRDLQHGTLFTPETAKLKQDDKTAID
jgi:hypothetical protein